MAVFLVLVFAGTGVFVYEVRAGADVRAASRWFVAWIGLLTCLVIVICWLTGERPRWRWGD